MPRREQGAKRVKNKKKGKKPCRTVQRTGAERAPNVGENLGVLKVRRQRGGNQKTGGNTVPETRLS